jgi:copper chaperone CopZ
LLSPIAAQAAEAKIVLDAHHASCVTCLPIVKGVLTNVKGVSAVWVSQHADVVAEVTFDDAQTSPEALIKATTDQGYPAELSKKTGG